MTLAHLLPDLDRLPAVERIRTALDAPEQASIALTELPDAAMVPMIAAAIRSATVPVALLTTRADRADSLALALNEYLPPDRQSEVWPSYDGLPQEQLPTDTDATIRRVAILHDLLTATPDKPPILVLAAPATQHRVLSPEELKTHSLAIATGQRAGLERVAAWAASVGYEASPLAQRPGTYARRGGIIDIFPVASEKPIRIDFWGDDVESIRAFDPATQRSEERLHEVILLPPFELPVWRLRDALPAIRSLDTRTLRPEVRDEWQRQLDLITAGDVPTAPDLCAGFLTAATSSVFDFFPSDSLLIVDKPEAQRLVLHQRAQQAAELYAGLIANGELPADIPASLFSPEEAMNASLDFRRVAFGGHYELPPAEEDAEQELVDAPAFAGRMADMVEALDGRLKEGWRIEIATDQVDRLTELLEVHDIYARRATGGVRAVPPPLAAGMVEIRHSDLVTGWSWDEAKLGVWTDFEIFGFRKQIRRGAKRTATETAAFLQSLTPGDHVVHVDHGVARYQGLTRVTTNGVEREYLLLEYQKGEKLYVPTDQSDRVTRYSGGGIDPTLNKLGSGEWISTKRRVKRAVREMAYELVQLYSRREAGAGFQYPEDTIWDAELAESFPYVETPDQLKAIDAVKEDMESSRPMDRLVCGDVGFGKTEVAIRAAFKAVNAGRQVAVLVPTTVLALQHFATFAQRLAAYPVKVEMLSRLKSKREQQETLERLREGTADIVIGTHRLVQRDVSFKNLGLVVVDEEQRFGVRQKEFLKQLKTEVDVLTMSATPIPRTLHMSLAGIRDISMMETAPQSRLPIRTFVTAFTDQLVREVILREVERGGQIYVVHNRVHDIDALAARLHKIVPEVGIGIGHGQMDEKVLEDVILSFIRQEFEVLLSTTIIESGIDIPNVNTIIIDNADTLGLTQLYQLRGRVGRGLNRAYAYLLYQPHKVLRAEAEERLEAIQEATELGAGLRVAMRDLEIRGAGNILGAEQSGHIASIGYDLYVRLLSQAVTEIRSGAPIAEQGPVTLDLPLTALIPEDYIADTELRLNTYREVAAVPTLHQLGEKRDELTDRFGDPPEEVEHLLALIRLRLRCEQLGIDSVVEREREIVIRPVSLPESGQASLKRVLGKAIRFTPSSIRIRLLELRVPWQDALDAVLDRIEQSRVEERAVAD